MPLIELDQVGRAYDTISGTVRALDGINLTIERGELVVVLGPSGSGKTTLLNLVGALDTATTGQALVAGHELTAAARRELFRFRRETVCFIFQSFNLFPALTAFENVRFGADVAGRPDAAGVARDMLERVGLADRATHFPAQLSGGEQQRVAIARALATGNPVVLADEPTGELDYQTGREILRLLREQTLDGERAVVLVTHNREIARVADRVVELSSGQIVSDGPPEGGTQPVDELRW
ncbi:MAG: ABC transporter ATP-binding protein [Actinobacteria bacterium]|nr:ABC transporter ATP-binding protein [Actinomycetota bacterium]